MAVISATFARIGGRAVPVTVVPGRIESRPLVDHTPGRLYYML
jgi:hypothetical protein